MKLKIFYFLSLLLLMSCGEMTDFENDNVIAEQAAASRSADATAPYFKHSFYISRDYINLNDPSQNSTNIIATFTSSEQGYTAIVKLYSEKTGEEVDENMVTVTRNSNLNITAVFNRGGIYYGVLEVYGPSGSLYTTIDGIDQILVY